MPAKSILYRVAILGLQLLSLPSSAEQAPAQSGERADGAAGAELRTLRLPVDHRRPDEGRFSLSYEITTPFDPARPTVFVIADAQQFFVRAGAMAGLRERIFGDGLNGVGVIGRGVSEDLVRRVRREDGSVDWVEAYRLFHAGQWIDDIEAVRRDLLGDGSILLYGRSGGAFLLNQYLARHGAHVSRAFSQAAVTPQIDARFGFRHDRFWEEISGDLQTKLIEALSSRPAQRETLVRILQRQNFFVPKSELAHQRRRLIEAFHAGDEAGLRKAREDYQVDAVARLRESDLGIAMRVRLFEFAWPKAEIALSPDQFYPSHEQILLSAAPLLTRWRQGDLVPYETDYTKLGSLETEVFLLAGRWDHVCDYRSQVALTAHHRRATLLLADDDHVFSRLNERGLYGELVRSFLLSGGEGEAFRAVLRRLEDLRWTEW